MENIIHPSDHSTHLPYTFHTPLESCCCIGKAEGKTDPFIQSPRHAFTISCSSSAKWDKSTGGCHLSFAIWCTLMSQQGHKTKAEQFLNNSKPLGQWFSRLGCYIIVPPLCHPWILHWTSQMLPAGIFTPFLLRHCNDWDKSDTIICHI